MCSYNQINGTFASENKWLLTDVLRNDWGFEGFPAEWVPYKSASLAVQDMINGNVKYVIIDAAPAESITKAINAMQ